jgi:hypothetical protein
VVWLDSIHTMILQDLGLEKPLARWVPQFFLDEQKLYRYVVCAAASAGRHFVLSASATDGRFLA